MLLLHCFGFVGPFQADDDELSGSLHLMGSFSLSAIMSRCLVRFIKTIIHPQNCTDRRTVSLHACRAFHQSQAGGVCFRVCKIELDHWSDPQLPTKSKVLWLDKEPTRSYLGERKQVFGREKVFGARPCLDAKFQLPIFFSGTYIET